MTVPLVVGWIGLVLTVVLCCISSYTGDLLGKCWGKVQEKRPQYKMFHVRDPYPTIGEIAFGKPGRFAEFFLFIIVPPGGMIT